MVDQKGSSAERPPGESFPGRRTAGPASRPEELENPLADATLADRLEVDPERGDVKG